MSYDHLLSPLPPSDSCDIGIVQSAVGNSSKIKITFIKCLVTQESSPCGGEGSRIPGNGPGYKHEQTGRCICQVHSPRLECKVGCRIHPKNRTQEMELPVVATNLFGRAEGAPRSWEDGGVAWCSCWWESSLTRVIPTFPEVGRRGETESETL